MKVVQIYITLRDWETEINWLKYVDIIYSCWNESSIIGECLSLLHLLQRMYVFYVRMSRHDDINCLMWQNEIRQIVYEWQIIFLTVVMCRVFVCFGSKWDVLKEHDKTCFCVCVFICFDGEWDILKKYDKDIFSCLCFFMFWGQVRCSEGTWQRHIFVFVFLYVLVASEMFWRNMTKHIFVLVFSCFDGEWYSGGIWQNIFSCLCCYMFWWRVIYSAGIWQNIFSCLCCYMFWWRVIYSEEIW